jgi:hypothetical protein
MGVYGFVCQCGRSSVVCLETGRPKFTNNFGYFKSPQKNMKLFSISSNGY